MPAIRASAHEGNSRTQAMENEKQIQSPSRIIGKHEEGIINVLMRSLQDRKVVHNAEPG